MYRAPDDSWEIIAKLLYWIVDFLILIQITTGINLNLIIANGSVWVDNNLHNKKSIVGIDITGIIMSK